MFYSNVAKINSTGHSLGVSVAKKYQMSHLNQVQVDYASSIILTSILTSSHWFPLVGCGVPVGLNDGSMKPSLAYV